MTRYSKNHIWIRYENDIAEIGITEYAAEKLGNIMFVNLPDTGEELVCGERFGDVESIKTVSDLISPIDGEVTEINETLPDEPEIISDDPAGTWFIKARIRNFSDELMSEEEYNSLKESL